MDLQAINNSGDLQYNHKRGFDRIDTDSMGDVTYGNATTRTFSITKKAGQDSFDFFADGKLYQKTGVETLACPDATGTYYWYFDTSGVLQVALNGTISHDGFVLSAICGMAYYNKEEATFEGAIDEQHGVDGSGGFNAETHLYEHLTNGLKHSHGGDVIGLVDGSSVMTKIEAGVHHDEDIILVTPEETTFSFMYLKTQSGVDGWVFTAADANIGHIVSGDTYLSYNGDTGSGVMDLIECGTSTDYVIMLIAQTNLATHKRVKVIGQQVYSSRSNARLGLSNALKAVELNGLPSAEFEWQYAYICKRSGDLEDSGSPNNDTYVDLRGIKIATL